MVLPGIRPPYYHGHPRPSTPLVAGHQISPGYRENADLTGCMRLGGRPCLKLARNRLAQGWNILQVLFLLFVIEIAILFVFIVVEHRISVDVVVASHVDHKCGSQSIHLLWSCDGTCKLEVQMEGGTSSVLGVALGSTNPML